MTAVIRILWKPTQEKRSPNGVCGRLWLWKAWAATFCFYKTIVSAKLYPVDLKLLLIILGNLLYLCSSSSQKKMKKFARRQHINCYFSSTSLHWQLHIEIDSTSIKSTTINIRCIYILVWYASITKKSHPVPHIHSVPHLHSVPHSSIN